MILDGNLFLGRLGRLYDFKLTEGVEHGSRGELLVPNGRHVSEVDFATHADEDHLQRAGSKKVELISFLKGVEGADAAGEL